MNKVSHEQIIGIDVSRDWLDVHCLPETRRLRLPNSDVGQAQLVDLAQSTHTLVCFEATGGQEWRLWTALDAAGISTRQLPPAQIKAFAASRGTRAKTDRIDAELIARFMAFGPDAGRELPHEKLRLLRALASKRAQLVETHKRLLAQIKAHEKLGTDGIFTEVDAELRELLGRQIGKLEDQIAQPIAADQGLAKTADILRSVLGIGPVASTILIAEMPELGQLSGEQAAASRAWLPLLTIAVRCAASAPLVADGDRYDTSCSRLLWSRVITIHISRSSQIVCVTQANHTKSSSQQSLESSLQSRTHS